MSDGDEFLEPVDLTTSSPDGGAKKKSWGKGILLILLLSVWSVGVYIYFSREAEPTLIPEIGPTAMPSANPSANLAETPAVLVVTPTVVSTPMQVAKKMSQLRVETDPDGVTVSRDGQFEGLTPLWLENPQEGQEINFRKTGYDSLSLRLDKEQIEKGLQIQLNPLLGRVRLDIRPPNSKVVVNGKFTTLPADGRLDLPLTPQLFEVSFPGYLTKELKVTPASSYERTITIHLDLVPPPAPILPVGEEPEDAEPLKQTAQGLMMLRPELPLKAQLGSARGTSGRQSNEVELNVELTRNFRISKTEISNAQFRKFRPEHQSGRWKGIDLNADSLPVVNIRWEDAVAYCNWLSEQEKLPPAYIEKVGKWEFSEKPGTGYRLPTEAEWEALARMKVQKALFGWGEKMPPPSGTINLAGKESRKLFGVVLEDYQDPFLGPAVVDKADEGPMEIRGLYGNVKEWVHDGYGIPPRSSKVFSDPLNASATNFHVIKGASWQDAGIVDLRIARRRYGNEPAVDLGFRVARYIDSSP